MLKILRIHQFKTADVRFSQISVISSLFYSTDKTDFPLVPAVFSGLSEHIYLSTIQYHGNPMFLPFPPEIGK